MVIQNTTVPTTTASTTGTLTCSTTTVALNSTLSGMNYTWTAPSGGSVSTASTQATTASGAAGIYTISVVDPANGCSYTTTTAVTQNTAVPTSSASSTGTLTCVTSTVGLNSSLSGMNYTWTAPSGGSVSTNSTQATTASGAPGDYTLTVMDSSNGCTYTTTANVPQNIAIPTGVSAGSNQTLTCPSNSVTLTGSVSTPTNPTINWTGPNVCGTATTLVTSACAAGAYTLTVTDPLNGCSTASMVTVAPNAGSPTVTVSSSTLVIDCNNATRSVTVTSTPNTDVTFNWSPSPSSVSAIGDIATFNIANTYICTVTNTLSNCSTPVQVVVTTNTVAPSIAITGTQSLTCANPSAVISTTTSASVTYTWTGTLVSGQGTGTVTVNAAAIYTVNITDAANGCTNTASTQVVSDSNAPVATISVTSTNSVITCGNTSVNLLANVTPTTATYSYTWSPSGGNAAVANVTAPGIYVVTVLNPSTGCQQTSQPITIISNTTPPSATVNNATIACGASSTGIGGSAITTATNASFNWTTSGTGTIVGGSTSSPTVNASGQYVVTITDNNNGCTSTASVNVSQANVTAAFTANPLSGTAPLDVNFTNQSTGASGYSWNFGDLSSVTNISGATNPSHTFNTIGTYNVVLTASNGACTSTATISIEVLENSSIIVPNVFTPNGDHSNDVFKITSTGLETLNCDIFNRWGLKLFTISSPNDSWDGGSAVDGTYFFILTAKGFDGKEFKEQGFISLFR